jgi:hypothetical protein
MLFATRQAAPYNMLLTFGVPVVQVRATSNVSPSSSVVFAGRATMATPTNWSSQATPTAYLCIVNLR